MGTSNIAMWWKAAPIMTAVARATIPKLVKQLGIIGARRALLAGGSLATGPGAPIALGATQTLVTALDIINLGTAVYSGIKSGMA